MAGQGVFGAGGMAGKIRTTGSGGGHVFKLISTTNYYYYFGLVVPFRGDQPWGDYLANPGGTTSPTLGGLPHQPWGDYLANPGGTTSPTLEGLPHQPWGDSLTNPEGTTSPTLGGLPIALPVAPLFWVGLPSSGNFGHPVLAALASQF